MRFIKTWVFKASLLALLALGLVVGPIAQPASAAPNCPNFHVYVPQYYNWVVNVPGSSVNYNYLFQNVSTYPDKSQYFSVPYNSSCSYINLNNITGGWGTGGHCWSFRLWNRTTGVISSESGYCSDSNDYNGLGRQPVANGTAYSILIVANNNIQANIYH
jgi:hypothetical protein